MTFHSSAITSEQQDVLRQLGPMASDHNFYLGGGTALALQLGHRRSVDFDWFTAEHLSDPMQLAQQLRDEGLNFATGQIARGTLHGTISDVRVSFLEYRYPLLQSLVRWPKYECALAGLDDLACMKLSAIAQRGAKRDFVDLYALLTTHRPLSVLLDRYRQKYETNDIAHVLYALVYFDDAESERMPVLFWDTDWAVIKQEIRKQVKEVAG